MDQDRDNEKKNPESVSSSDKTAALFVSARKKQLEQQELERTAREREEKRLAAEAEVQRLEAEVEMRRKKVEEEAQRVDLEARVQTLRAEKLRVQQALEAESGSDAERNGRSVVLR